MVTTPLDVARTAEVCALSAGMQCKVGRSFLLNVDVGRGLTLPL